MVQTCDENRDRHNLPDVDLVRDTDLHDLGLVNNHNLLYPDDRIDHCHVDHYVDHHDLHHENRDVDNGSVHRHNNHLHGHRVKGNVTSISADLFVFW